MSFFGHKLSCRLSARVRASSAFCALALFGVASPSLAQTAPQVLPYTMSTYAGPHAQYTASAIGGPCGALIALDSAGDGCLAPFISVGADPHDLRVDGQGSVYFLDNSTYGVTHKFNPYTGLLTIYQGSLVTSKYCGASVDKYGDNCTSTDGAANVSGLYSGQFKASRGLGVAPNEDVFIASYNDSYDHKITFATGLLSITAGNGTATSGLTPTDGTIAQSQVNGTRGIGADGNGNVYIADTGDNVVRMVSNGKVSTLTMLNTSGAKTPVSAVAAGQAVLDAPEDVQVDAFGNIFIADAGNALVRVIYEGGYGNGPFFGISSPMVGVMYVVAGYNATIGGTTNSYPSDGTTPTFPATTVAIADRKISLDSTGNLFINDASHQVVWFVDHNTGYIRVLAGHYSMTTPVGCGAAQTDTVGDGCPGSLASLNATSTNTGFGGSPDNQGNYYFSDPEGASNNAGSRIRKVLSGLSFPTATVGGAAVTQNVFLHFGANDTPAVAGAFTLANTGTDFAVGAQTCNAPNADGTTDCILPVTFAPSQPGYDTATLLVKSTAGAVASFLLNGTGATPTLAFDPGNITVASSTVKNPQGAAIDFAGRTYIADTGNNRVLIEDRSGNITPFAGTGTSSYTGDGGAATSATMSGPTAVAVDTAGNVYIADTGNNVIRRVNAAGVISTYAGGSRTVCSAATDTQGDGCLATQASFSAPAGLVADNLGQLFVADTGNNLIRQIGTNGFVLRLAGGASGVCSGATDVDGDGCGAGQTILSSPTALAFDFTGKNLFVADTGHNIVRKIYLSTSIAVASATSYTVTQNPVTRVAGNLSPGGSVDSNSLATSSSLTAPTGVAVDPAGNVYIADTGDSAVRLVNASTGVLSTIAGIVNSPGSSAGTSAISTTLASPAAVTVSPTGTLTILDSGNNRVLTDARSQTTFTFGRTNVTFSSPTQNITELNIGTASATLPASFTSTGNTNQFSLTPGANGNSSIPACAAGAFAPGTICNLQAVFTPTTTGTYSATYTQTPTGASGSAPSITLNGVGAIQTTTTSTVTQSVPATGNSQFGASLTLAVTVSAAACNASAPSCTPTGSVTFIVDGTANAPVTLTNAMASQVVTGLSVGPHTVACTYSGDDFYAASKCANVLITVGQASTSSTLTVTNNNQPQYDNCTPVTVGKTSDLVCGLTNLTAKVVSLTSGQPTGVVTYSVGGTSVGTAPINPTTGQATLTLAEYIGALSYALDTSNFTNPNTTLAPGTYSLTCSYGGSTNFATSACAAISFTVLPETTDFSIVPFGCSAATIGGPAGNAATLAEANSTCVAAQLTFNGAPQVAVAQGATTDVTVFLLANNTVSGPVTFKCSGMPANSDCTFAPSVLTLTAGNGVVNPIPVDVTFFNDLLPGEATSSVHAPGMGSHTGGTTFAILLGWPLTLLGLFGIFKLRRKSGAARGLSLLAAALLMVGSSLLMTGCGAGGPGAYKPNFTPAGTYPVTISVTAGGVTHTTLVYYTVTSPGISGQE